MKFGWLSPHFNVPAAVLAVAVALYLVAAAPFLGRRNYGRLVKARRTHLGALEGHYRRVLVRQWLLTAVALVTLAVGPKVHPGDLGLAWPRGQYATWLSWYSLVLCGVVLVSGLAWRRRAQRGKTVPGQKLASALVPVTSAERRLAAVMALTAGTTEEILYRGLLIATGVGVFGLSPYLAAFLAAVVFGLAHLYQGWRGVLLVSLLGGFFGAVYLGTGSLLFTVVIHISLDLRALVMVPLSPVATSDADRSALAGIARLGQPEPPSSSAQLHARTQTLAGGRGDRATWAGRR